MDSFSLAVAKEIFAAFPEWEQLAREDREDDGDAFLVVEVTPPVRAEAERGLVILTSNEEVTVGFDHYHSHFDQWGGDDDHFGTRSALEFIKQVIAERVAVVSWWQGAEWRGSAQLEAGAVPTPPSWQATFDRIRIRSWEGSLNADISA